METKEASTIYKLRKRIENVFAYLKAILKHLQYQTIGIEKANKELTQEVLARNLIMIFNLDKQQKEKKSKLLKKKSIKTIIITL